MRCDMHLNARLRRPGEHVRQVWRVLEAAIVGALELQVQQVAAWCS
jgi:hypothetical protein